MRVTMYSTTDRYLHDPDNPYTVIESNAKMQLAIDCLSKDFHEYTSRERDPGSWIQFDYHRLVEGEEVRVVPDGGGGMVPYSQ